MKQIICGIAIGLITPFLFSQTLETKKIQAFTKLSIYGKTFMAELAQGEENKIEFLSSDLTMDKLSITESNGELKIQVKGIFTTGNVKLKIYCTNLPAFIDINNGAYLKTLDPLTIPQVTLTTNSDGYIHLNLISENIVVHANSGGDLTLEGKSKNFTVNANSNATVRAEQMDVEIATIKTIMGAEVYVAATNSINCTTASNAKVHIYKPYAPNIVETNETGGQVIRE